MFRKAPRQGDIEDGPWSGYRWKQGETKMTPYLTVYFKRQVRREMVAEKWGGHLAPNCHLCLSPLPILLHLCSLSSPALHLVIPFFLLNLILFIPLSTLFLLFQYLPVSLSLYSVTSKLFVPLEQLLQSPSYKIHHPFLKAENLSPPSYV